MGITLVLNTVILSFLKKLLLKVYILLKKNSKRNMNN